MGATVCDTWPHSRAQTRIASTCGIASIPSRERSSSPALPSLAALCDSWTGGRWGTRRDW